MIKIENNIKIFNDEKEKFNSFEAEIDNDYLITMMGYGSTEEEAIENLKINIAGRIKFLENIYYNEK
jgi:hypothetical protein